MATIDYDAIAEEAQKALALAGMDVVLKRVTGGGTGWNDTTPSTTPETVKGVVDYQRIRDANGTLVGQTMMTVYLAVPTGAAPTKNDIIQVSGKDYPIIEVRPVSPAGTPVLFECDLSK